MGPWVDKKRTPPIYHWWNRILPYLTHTSPQAWKNSSRYFCFRSALSSSHPAPLASPSRITNWNICTVGITVALTGENKRHMRHAHNPYTHTTLCYSTAQFQNTWIRENVFEEHLSLSHSLPPSLLSSKRQLKTKNKQKQLHVQFSLRAPCFHGSETTITFLCKASKPFPL